MTRLELFGLGGIGLLTTICFSLAGTYLTRAYDIGKDLDFSKLQKDVPLQLIAKWEATAGNYTTFGYIIAAIGLLIFLGGGATIWSVIRSTTHDD